MGALDKISLKSTSFLFAIILFLGFLLSQEVVSAEEVDTSLEVGNLVPYLNNTIESPIWTAKNTNLTNYLNLNDYFADINGNILTFYATATQNVTITIQGGGNVTIIPDIDFEGTENVTFLASDGSANASSNEVQIIVGGDSEFPLWFSPSVDPPTIYQNTKPTFSTTWTDNSQLKEYIFSINQGQGWLNYSTEEFTGTENISTHRLTISKSGGLSILWRFYARDTNGNQNVTDIQQTYVEKPPPVYEDSNDTSSGGSGSSGSSSEEGTVSSVISAIQDFVFQEGDDTTARGYTVDAESILVSLREGKSVTKTIRITNTGEEALSFSLGVEGLADLVQLNKGVFTISPGSFEDVSLEFYAKKGIKPDQYLGTLKIDSNTDSEIPIVFDIKSADAKIEVNLEIEEESRVVKSGEKVYAAITITNLGEQESIDKTLTYAIKDFKGTISDSKEQEITLTTTYEQLLNLTVLENLNEGEYLFYARYGDENTFDFDSKLFKVSNKNFFNRYLSKIVLSIAAIFFAVLSYALYKSYTKNKRKRKLLELYLMLTELKALVKKGELDKALQIYTRIKLAYGQRVLPTSSEEKERLKKELQVFVKRVGSKEVTEEEVKKQIDVDSTNKENPQKDSPKKGASPMAAPAQKAKSEEKPTKQTPIKKVPQEQKQIKPLVQKTGGKSEKPLPKKVEELKKSEPIKETPKNRVVPKQTQTDIPKQPKTQSTQTPVQEKIKDTPMQTSQPSSPKGDQKEVLARSEESKSLSKEEKVEEKANSVNAKEKS